jgi:phenylalanyl-tRNA synthetase beta chain
MGGQDTEIDSDTKRIIIECANFDRYNIRRSSMKLGLFTEAVTRFTKALAPEMCDRVLAESTRLIAQLSGAAVASVVKDDYASPANPVSVKVSIPRMNAHLGTALSQNEATTLLENISYTVDVEDADHIIVHAPYFRKDVTLPQDINEDIGRQYGYNNIKVTLPTRSVLPATTNRSLQLKQKIRECLSGNGLNEILTYNFTGKDHFLKAGLSIESAYHIKNSLSPELEYMRYSLIPSILEKAYENEKSGYTQFGLYEINAGHNKEEMDEEKLPLERWLVSLVLVTPSETPYYQVKVYTDLLAQKLNLRQVDYVLLADTPTTQLPAWIQRILPAFDMNRSAVILSAQKEKEYIGVVGEVSNNAKANFGIKQGAAVAEIDISALGALMMHGSSYVEPSRFPAVSQDLCFAVKMDVPYEQLRREILSALEDTNLRIKVEPLDIYQPKDAQDRKQITFRVFIQHTEKTLQPKDIQHLREKVVKKVSKKFDAKLI